MYEEKDIIKECKNKNLNYKRIQYMETGGKKRRCVVYECNVHKKYGEQFKPVEKIFAIKNPCIYCNHTRLDLTIQEDVNKINPNIMILDNYVNTETQIKCKCIIHDEIWSARPLELLKGKVGCSKCISIKKHDNSRIKPLEQLKKEIRQVNPNIIITGDYYNTHRLTDFKCLIHNKSFRSLPCNILNQTSTCPICAKESIRDKEGLTKEDLQRKINENGLQLTLIGDYINNNTSIECKCLIHNITYMTSPRNFLYKNSSGCPKCFQSKGERKLHLLLNEMGFDVESQYSFDDCKNINKLRFDFYDKSRNIAFEYQGQQHYQPINFGGISDDEARIEFENNQKRDDIKRKYCNDNNIKLICIPYWEYDNMKQFLINKV